MGVQSRTHSGGLQTAETLTAGTPISGGTFHSELEAALRRSDVSPEGPEERRDSYGAPEQFRRLDDSGREGISHSGERSSPEVASESQDSPDQSARNPGHDDPSAMARTAEDSPGTKAPSEANGNQESKTAQGKGEAQAAASAEEAEASEGGKRKRLLALKDPGKPRDGEALSALVNSGAEAAEAKQQKLSPALKAGGSLASGFVPPGTEAGAAEAAFPGAGSEKGAKHETEGHLRSVRGNPEAGQAAKGAAASNLGTREIPRGPQENGNRKGFRPEGDQDAQGDKDAGKSSIRTTVVSRTRNSGEPDGSGGRRSALQDSSGRTDLSFVKESSDGPRFDTPAVEAGRPGTASLNSSSLAGSRDVVPRHLQQQLKDFATGDVVRHARFVIKENAGGEIRLLLKPEQLGTVRVRLEVQDNRIAGRIIVENTTVRDAFEQTLSDLHRAFREAGLETGSLEVTVGEDGQASGKQSMAQGRRAQAVEELAENVPTLFGELDEPRMINVYA